MNERDDELRRKLGELKTPFYAWLGASMHALEIFGEVAEDMVTSVVKRNQSTAADVTDAGASVTDEHQDATAGIVDAELVDSETAAEEKAKAKEQAKEAKARAKEEKNKARAEAKANGTSSDSVRDELENGINDAMNAFSARYSQFVGQGESFGNKLRDELKGRVDEQEITKSVETVLGRLAEMTEQMAASFRKEREAMSERRKAAATSAADADNVEFDADMPEADFVEPEGTMKDHESDQDNPGTGSEENK
ncbi:hypothetical protein [Corynebacterium sp. H78]|uniref:hypothetical protein n=1 Tax=Corynebacterium sp. H78 TaxID=3133417 RepID=UPI0030B2E6ED